MSSKQAVRLEDGSKLADSVRGRLHVNSRADTAVEFGSRAARNLLTVRRKETV